MRKYSEQTFSVGSPIFFILLLLVTVAGFSMRKPIGMPGSLSTGNASILHMFGFPLNFLYSNPNIFHSLSFILNLATIPAVYCLGKAAIGRVAGLTAATFVAFYPYFAVNVYSPNTYFIFFFTLYLTFLFISLTTGKRRWHYASGILFMISVMLEPAVLILGLIPYIYNLIKQRHIALLYAFLFFVLGLVTTLGLFVLIAALQSRSINLLPLGNVFGAFWKNILLFCNNPLNYITNVVYPYLQNNFLHPVTNGTHAYLHYIILTLTVLGALYSFVNEHVRLLSIILIIMLLTLCFVPFEYAAVLLILILLAGYMIDKVINDVFIH
ncbi:MAG: glycosyltransferase family 39 protein [Clostridia bacterium]|nr:glycosyltransferase family 39 protein [Clostridia bacterium]